MATEIQPTTPRVTREDVEQLLAAEAKATRGPWAMGEAGEAVVVTPSTFADSTLRTMLEHRFGVDAEAEWRSHVDFFGGEMVCDSAVESDRALIAATRNAIRPLCESYLAVLDENDALKIALDDASREGDQRDAHEEAMRDRLAALEEQIATLTQSRDQWREAAESTLAKMNAAVGKMEAEHARLVRERNAAEASASFAQVDPAAFVASFEPKSPTPHPAPTAQEPF